MFSCARIYVEVDLEKGLPESIMLSIDGWNHLQIVDYEQIPFKCKYCHEYGHFAKSCPKKPEKPISDSPPSEGWNVASGKRAAKPSKQQIPTSKSPPENRFEVLETETQEAENQEENPEMEHQLNSEPQVIVPTNQEQEGREEGSEVPLNQGKETQEEGPGNSGERKDKATTSEGSITRSRARTSTKENIDTSIEEQEPLSRKGRKSNKIIKEQEATREKVAGKQANLDFLVKTSQANKYLLSAEEEKKEKDKALKQQRK